MIHHLTQKEVKNRFLKLYGKRTEVELSGYSHSSFCRDGTSIFIVENLTEDESKDPDFILFLTVKRPYQAIIILSILNTILSIYETVGERVHENYFINLKHQSDLSMKALERLRRKS